jgi:hypothetical protein
MPMTLKEFQALDETTQANAVWDGTFVSSRVVDDVFMQRYDLGGFSVEVYYDPMANKVFKLHAVTIQDM